MMRLPNVKILLCWSSRKQIYGFVENRTFLEQFVSRGYQHTLQFYGSVGPLECIFMAFAAVTLRFFYSINCQKHQND